MPEYLPLFQGFDDEPKTELDRKYKRLYEALRSGEFWGQNSGYDTATEYGPQKDPQK